MNQQRRSKLIEDQIDTMNLKQAVFIHCIINNIKCFAIPVR